jgi:hypothetical protein
MRQLNRVWVVLFAVFMGSSVADLSGALLNVSLSDGSLPPPAGGGGDSTAPIMTPDGRFVLFSSTAKNLSMPGGINSPYSQTQSKGLNVFLRDRLNGTTTTVSVNLGGLSGGNGDSYAAGISTNGRYVMFESAASDLVANDTNNAADIFVRDLLSQTTTLVSVGTNGAVGNRACRGATMTPDGRYVAFVSAANNLVDGDTNGLADVFVRDLQTGTTTLASAGASRIANSSPGSSEAPDITPDGRYVAFFSTATNLVPGARAVAEIFVRDMVAGATRWISTNAQALVTAKLGGNAASYNHFISEDGKYVVFESSTNPPSMLLPQGLILRHELETGLTEIISTNGYVQRADYPSIRSIAITPDARFVAFISNTNGMPGTTTCVELWDAMTGLTTLISGDLSNSIPDNSTCDWPAIDPTGRYVAFLSNATNMVSGFVADGYHVFLHDAQSGTTTLMDAGTNGNSSSLSPTAAPTLSQDGKVVAFESPDNSLVSADRNRFDDVFVSNTTNSLAEMVSVRDPNLPSLTANGWSLTTLWPLSLDGRYVAFASEADDLLSNDINRCRDIFVRDLQTGINSLVSANTNGLPADGSSSEAVISGDGHYVAFSSVADDLVAGDTNRLQDVFVRSLQNNSTRLASVATNGRPANGAAYGPVLSTDGTYVLFRSKALNLAPGVYPGGTPVENLFIRNLQTLQTWALTTNGIGSASMTPDGHYVAFVGNSPSPSVPPIYVWDSQTGALAYGTPPTAIGTAPAASVAISADGNRVAYSFTNSLLILDRAAHTTRRIATRLSLYQGRMVFSSDANSLVFGSSMTSSFSGTNSIYLYDYNGQVTALVSHDSAGLPANSWSDSPDISPDGRFVIYRSVASNIVAGDSNGIPDIFVYDRLTTTNVLVSAPVYGTVALNGWPMAPSFSADAHFAIFSSWGSNLSPQDFSGREDVFIYGLSYISISRDPSDGAPVLAWPTTLGLSYFVQYKTNLNDISWQTATGPIAISANKATWKDLSAGNGQRFYRVMSF